MRLFPWQHGLLRLFLPLSRALSLSLPSPFHFPSTPERGHVTVLTSGLERQAEERVSLQAFNKPPTHTTTLGVCQSPLALGSVTQALSSFPLYCSASPLSLAYSHLCFFFWCSLFIVACCFSSSFSCCHKLTLERKCWVMDC